MDEGEIACGGFVVSRGKVARVLQPVEAALDAVPQGVDEVVDRDLDFAALAHGNDGNAAALLDIGAHVFRVVSLVVRDFPAGDFRILAGSERRKAAAKAFDCLNERAYSFPMISNRDILAATKEVGIRNPNDLRPQPMGPHEFVWK